MPMSSKFPTESTGEKIVKIGQYLAKICTKYDSLDFLGHPVDSGYRANCTYLQIKLQHLVGVTKLFQLSNVEVYILLPKTHINIQKFQHCVVIRYSIALTQTFNFYVHPVDKIVHL